MRYIVNLVAALGIHKNVHQIVLNCRESDLYSTLAGSKALCYFVEAFINMALEILEHLLATVYWFNRECLQRFREALG